MIHADSRQQMGGCLVRKLKQILYIELTYNHQFKEPEELENGREPLMR